jgi:hypothetical protein
VAQNLSDQLDLHFLEIVWGNMFFGYLWATSDWIFWVDVVESANIFPWCHFTLKMKIVIDKRSVSFVNLDLDF